MAQYLIHELAKKVGVSTDTIRFYEKKHLLNPRKAAGAQITQS